MNRRVRDPYARWCGRRGAVRRLPIPITTQQGFTHEISFICIIVGYFFVSLC